MESCFQLLSLFYLTIGRNNEAPAAYSLTSTIKRLLDHLKEVDLYSAKDLASLKSTLEELATSIANAIKEPSPEKQHSPYLLELLQKRVERCQGTLAILQHRLHRIADPLLPTYEKIISILRQTSLANTKSKVCDIIMCFKYFATNRYVCLVFFNRSPEAAKAARRSRRQAQGWKVRR